jgi:phage host-nuclease inhibitor protein Gam
LLKRTATPPEVQRVLEAADPDLQAMRGLKRRMDEIEANRALRTTPLVLAMGPLQSELNGINSETEEELRPLKVEYDRLEDAVKKRIDRNQNRLVEWFKKKTIPFLSGGQALIRKNKKKLKMNVDELEVVRALREAGFPGLVEEKPTVKVEELKKNEAALEALGDRVAIEQDTKIVIELE